MGCGEQQSQRAGRKSTLVLQNHEGYTAQETEQQTQLIPRAPKGHEGSDWIGKHSMHTGAVPGKLDQEELSAVDRENRKKWGGFRVLTEKGK